MKKLNGLLLVMLCVWIPALQSCDKDDDHFSLGQYGVTLATVKVISGDSYYLDSDNFGKLWLSANDVYGYEPIDGERAIVRFNPLYSNYEGYDMAVKLERIHPILTKQVEELTAENEKEFGNDPVVIYQGDLWLDNGYLNVIFQYDVPLKGKHLVSLVRNLTSEPENDDYLHLEYRYNTYGDLSGHWNDGIVSFNLNSLDFKEKKGLKVKLNSSVNGEVEVRFDLKENVSASNAMPRLIDDNKASKLK